jgi:hypothetical protein
MDKCLGHPSARRQVIFRSRQNTSGDGLRQEIEAPSSAAKQIQAKPNKSKQKRLDLLGFIRPNPDFSMGYGDSK